MLTYFYTLENKNSRWAYFCTENYILPENINNYIIVFNKIEYKIISVKDIFYILYPNDYHQITERHCIIEKI